MRMKKLRGWGGEKGKGKRTQDIGMGIRDCHDLKKRGLAMTDWVDEILTASKNEASGWLTTKIPSPLMGEG